VRRIFRLIIVLAGIVAIEALLSPWLVASAVGQRGLALPPTRHLITYAAWDGRTRTAMLLLPANYTRGCAFRLPLVISPHGRGESPASIASSWGRLPTRDDFAVVCPAGEGERLPNYSCAAPGQISDLARMPGIVQRALPWVHIDGRHVYAVGPSMGGQEALVLAAQYPDRIAAAASVDGLADLTAHFDQMPRPRRTGRLVLHDMVVECGGTPAQQPCAYALRSPLSYVANLASDGVPVELWWSRHDQVVVAQATRQSGLLYRSIKRLNPAAPVCEVVTDYRHCVAFCPSIALRQVVSFLRPAGRWRSTRVAQPPG
jgi:pimeloyl-ACP methyl ester carboxylesterase